MNESNLPNHRSCDCLGCFLDNWVPDNDKSLYLEDMKNQNPLGEAARTKVVRSTDVMEALARCRSFTPLI